MVIDEEDEEEDGNDTDVLMGIAKELLFSWWTSSDSKISNGFL